MIHLFCPVLLSFWDQFWDTITKIDTPIKLAALVVALVFLYFVIIRRKKINQQIELIKNSKEDDRASLIEQTIDEFNLKVDSSKISPSQTYKLISQSLKQKAVRNRNQLLVIIVIALMILIFAILSLTYGKKKDGTTIINNIAGKKDYADGKLLEKLKLGKTLASIKEELGEPPYDESTDSTSDFVYNLKNMDIRIISFDKKNIDAVTYNISNDSKEKFAIYPELYGGHELGSLFLQKDAGENYPDSITGIQVTRDHYIYYTITEAAGGGTTICWLIGSRDFNNMNFPDNDSTYDLYFAGPPSAVKDVKPFISKAKATYITVFYDFEGETISKIDPNGMEPYARKQ